jgi:hypothetical protein
MAVKLIGSFIIVSCVTMLVGASGYYGLTKVSGSLTEIEDVRLPSIQHLLTVSGQFEGLRVSMRTLLLPGLPKADRQRQYDDVAQTRETYTAAWKAYEALPRTPEEDKLLQELTAAVASWKKSNDNFMSLAKQWDASGIPEPNKLLLRLETFRTEMLTASGQGHREPGAEKRPGQPVRTLLHLLREPVRGAESGGRGRHGADQRPLPLDRRTAGRSLRGRPEAHRGDGRASPGHP